MELPSRDVRLEDCPSTGGRERDDHQAGRADTTLRHLPCLPGQGGMLTRACPNWSEWAILCPDWSGWVVFMSQLVRTGCLCSVQSKWAVYTSA